MTKPWKALSLAFLIAVLAIASMAQQHKALTNKDIVDMTRQSLAEDVIIKVIQASDTDFDTSADALTELQASGVVQPVIDAMVRSQSTKSAAGSGVAAPATSAVPVMAALPGAPSAAVTAATPPSAPADANAGEVLLKEGTEVPLKFASDISSKTASDGDTVELTLDGDLKVGDVVVAKQGAHAVAVVSNAKRAGMLGKPGELNIQLQHLAAGDNRVRVRGTKAREGDSKTGTAVALTVLFGPIGLIKHGKEVEVKAGTPLTAFVDQDIWLPPAS
jgi:hypothetical protein